MKKILLFLLLPGFMMAQDDVALTKQLVDTEEAMSHVWFLASDELRGRETGSPEIDIAASYIASQYRKYGIKPFNGSYYQIIPLLSIQPPKIGELTFDGKSKLIGKDFVAVQAVQISAESDVVFLDYGMPEDLTKKKVENKIVVVKSGKPGDSNLRTALGAGRDKRATVLKYGAKALIELFDGEQQNWERIRGYLHRSILSADAPEKGGFPHLLMNDPNGEMADYFGASRKPQMKIELGDQIISPLPSKNVVGVIEGTHPELKNEYILLSAHYDHIGIKSGTNGEDSIYNGARDNAIGVAAILSAAQSLAEKAAKRSILLLACTGEEKGLLGSRYYANNPPVELNKIVYNLNIDGGGYNDITKVSVMGLNRTSAAKLLKASAVAFGLEAFADPAPEQNLFDRSDNVSFAAKGIPAPTYSTGFTSFDDEIMKYYHQVTDNTESLDFNYISLYFKAYSLAARSIANMEVTPFWLPGDKYEEAGKKLYGR